MAEADESTEPINVFKIGDKYVFKHYFEDYEIFTEIRRYYTEYRFEVPDDKFEKVKDALEDHPRDLRVIEDINEYCVVKRKFTEHPDVLFEKSVLRTSTSDYNIFVMKDRDSVEIATERGATPLADADLGTDF